MTKQHTPGPWYIDCQNESATIGYRAIVDNEGYTVCEPSPMGQANARLIVAAPDLLAALQSFCGVYEGQDDVPRYVQKARAAIAKATGEA